MKKYLLFAGIAIVGWNTFSKPAGAEYFYPSTFGTNHYDLQRNADHFVSSINGSFSPALANDATLSHTEMALVGWSFYRKIELKILSARSSISDITYSRLGSDGVYSRKSSDTDSPEYLELALPPKVGHRWRYQAGNDDMECEIAALETMEIAGKTYEKCLKVKCWGTMNGRSAYILKYYAPNIGLVKLSSVVGGVGVEMTLADK